MNNKKALTHERLLEVLDYCQDTGVMKRLHKYIDGTQTWKISKCDQEGNISIDCRSYVALRVIWFWMTGEWPLKRVKACNGNRLDWRWENLCLSTNGLRQKQRPAAKTDPHPVIEYPPLERDRRIIKIGHRFITVNEPPSRVDIGEPSPTQSALFKKTGKLEC